MEALNKKILVLSFYYQPDLCAGSFRCSALVKELSNHKASIHVITTVPNRYKSFRTSPTDFKSQHNVKIDRINIPDHESGILDQVISFYYFYKAARKIASTNSYDLIFATSSRLFTAFLGARISRKKKVPLYLDIRDLFVDTMPNILPFWISFLIKPILKLIESYTFITANRINLVSKGFHPYFDEKYSDIPFSFFTNGIDKEFLDISQNTHEKKLIDGDISILYAGNIGEGQGLHKIVPQLAERLRSNVNFKIIGDGGQVQKIIDQVQVLNLDNVEIIPPMNREKLILEYLKADILFLHLNDYDAFKKVLPSKLFEYAAMNKPILAGITGYSAEFVKSEINNCEVFNPTDVIDAAKKFKKLNKSIKPRTKFIEKYDRKKIMEKMSKEIYDSA